MQVVGSDAWIALSALEASFYALLFGAVALVRRLPGWPVWTACLWVLTELAREYVPFGGFPWGRLAFAQADSPYRALASLGGFALLTFAVALTGSLLAAAAMAPPARPLCSAIQPANTATTGTSASHIGDQGSRPAAVSATTPAAATVVPTMASRISCSISTVAAPKSPP